MMIAFKSLGAINGLQPQKRAQHVFPDLLARFTEFKKK